MIITFLQYIKTRLKERSTWIAISGAVAAAAALTPPFSHIALIAGVLGALIPDGDIKSSDTSNDA